MITLKKTNEQPNIESTEYELDPQVIEMQKAVEENQVRMARKSRMNTILVCVGIVLFFLISKFFVSPVSVIGASMNPTYESGQILFAESRLIKPEPDYGDVVVFRNEHTQGSLYIKRLVGKPGDTLEIINGYLYRNGEMAENFDEIANEWKGILNQPFTLGPNDYFAMGDNRNNSQDCRVFGPIRVEDIKYIVF